MVPPYKHRNNLAERAIQTFKKHLKAALAGADPNFPLSEWDRLISQTNITINLLRSSRTNPRLSAHAYVLGEFNFTATPLAPPGTKIVAFISPEKRATWDLNGEVGWYVGPSMHHYRCVQCYFPRTRDVRDCDTVEFFPHSIPFPKVKLQDHLRQAATDIVTLLTQPPSSTVPSLQEGDPTRNALLTLAQILKRSDTTPEPTSTPDSATNTVSPPRVSKSPSKALLPRVPPDAVLQEQKEHAPAVIPFTNEEIEYALPRVEPTVPISTLQQHSNLPKNARFQNVGQHKYNLRSQSPHLIAQHMFNPQHTANHIYKENGKKETIDSLITGKSKDLWLRSLSND